MSYPQPLRYSITSWKQLPKCLSNNDKDLRITITEFVGNTELCGTRISVVHPRYGVLFTEVLGAFGSFTTSLKQANNYTGTTFELDTEHILQELRKFGFFISYREVKHLPKKLLEYLNTLRNLGFDKIRVLNVYSVDSTGDKKFKWYVVGFKTCAHGAWLNNAYSPSQKEFTEALLDGTAINISEMNSAKGFNWSWLDYVANIDDVLKENMEAIINGC